MDSSLGRRQGEDQPAIARVDRLEAQHVSEERPVRFGVVAEKDEVGTKDHDHIVTDCVPRRLGRRIPRFVPVLHAYCSPVYARDVLRRTAWTQELRRCSSIQWTGPTEWSI